MRVVAKKVDDPGGTSRAAQAMPANALDQIMLAQGTPVYTALSAD